MNTDTKTQITSIANNYADGIIKYAEGDSVKLDKILVDLELIKEILAGSPDLDEVLKNPSISSNIKNEIIDRVFTDLIEANEKNFLKILIDKNRFSEFNNIISAIKHKLEDIKGEKSVIITSAVPLDDETKMNIINKLEKRLEKSILPEWKENADIIGGLVIQAGDDVVDMSLLQRLDNLSKNITK